MASQSEAPDLLISDIMMPFLSGIELATQVKEICPNCKVLLVSGQVLTGDSLKNGQRFEFLSKPVHPLEMLRKIQSMTEAPAKPSVSEVPRKDLVLRSA